MNEAQENATLEYCNELADRINLLGDAIIAMNKRLEKIDSEKEARLISEKIHIDLLTRVSELERNLSLQKDENKSVYLHFNAIEERLKLLEKIQFDKTITYTFCDDCNGTGFLFSENKSCAKCFGRGRNYL